MRSRPPSRPPPPTNISKPSGGSPTCSWLQADGYTGEQIELFGDVLERLIKTIEIRALADVSARIALAEMSTQLASVKQAPPGVIRRLARHDEITIARPVLTESARLTPEDLVELAETKGEQHLLAISGRWWLNEVVTDALLKRHYPSVSLRLVSNPGAKMSAAGYRHRAEAGRSRSCTRGRDRHSRRPAGRPSAAIAAQRHRRRARAAVVARAAASCSRKSATRSPLAASGANREMSRTRDFTARRAASSPRSPSTASSPRRSCWLCQGAKIRRDGRSPRRTVRLEHRGDPPGDAKPARRRRADPLPRRRIELGNRRRRARQPLRLGHHGPPRTGEGAGSNTAN